MLGLRHSMLAQELAARDPQRVTHVFEGRGYTISELPADAGALAAVLRERDHNSYENETLVGAVRKFGSPPAVDPNAVKLILYRT